MYKLLYCTVLISKDVGTTFIFFIEGTAYKFIQKHKIKSRVSMEQLISQYLIRHIYTSGFISTNVVCGRDIPNLCQLCSVSYLSISSKSCSI